MVIDIIPVIKKIIFQSGLHEVKHVFLKIHIVQKEKNISLILAYFEDLCIKGDNFSRSG